LHSSVNAKMLTLKLCVLMLGFVFRAWRFWHIVWSCSGQADCCQKGLYPASSFV